MVALDEHASGLNLRMLGDPIEGVDGTHRDPDRQQDRLPLLVGPGEKHLLEPGDQRIAVL